MVGRAREPRGYTYNSGRYAALLDARRSARVWAEPIRARIRLPQRICGSHSSRMAIGGVGEAGFICREGSLQRIQPEFVAVVDRLRTAVGRVFGPSRLHSA